ncbi:MAG: DUF6438 domain-containing protein [Bacteroidota bacterium]
MTFVKCTATRLSIFFLFVIVLLGSCTPKAGKVIQEEDKVKEVEKALEAEMDEKEREVKKMEAPQPDAPDPRPEEFPIKEVPNEELVETGPYMIASLAKTPCYGRCPVFEVRVYSDGVVEFFGKANVNLIGHYKAKADQLFIDKLMQSASKAGYQQLESYYPADSKRIPDLPNVITYVLLDNQEKSITNNYMAPEALISFEQEFERLINTLVYDRVGE